MQSYNTEITTNISDIQAVIFDWAGTTYDFGSCAPIIAFQQLFESYQIPIASEEARLPMGSEKRQHIRQLLAMERIQAQWQKIYNQSSTEADITRLYHDFVPFQIEAIRSCAQSIPGLMRTYNFLHENQYRVGSNTGYSREMIDALLPIAKEEGFITDSVVCATEVQKGRPYPHMSLKNVMELGIENVNACVKVDDTTIGIEEGLNTGMWTVGVTISGNEVGLSLKDWQALDEALQQKMKEQAYQNLYNAGAHYVIDSISTLPGVLEDIKLRLARGERP